jgi:hypothetical protein
MKSFYLPLLLTLFATSTLAANPQPVAVYTFLCNGGQFQRSGPCPNGGRPDALILGSDGNFYGAAQDSMEGSSAPDGGAVFSLTSAGAFKLLHTLTAELHAAPASATAQQSRSPRPQPVARLSPDGPAPAQGQPPACSR